MSHSGYLVKVPKIKTKTNRKKLRRKIMMDTTETEDSELTDDNHHIETRRSSYYSLTSWSSSELKVLETYDEFLNLKEIDIPERKKATKDLIVNNSDSSKSEFDGSLFVLKQICTDFHLCPLAIVKPEREYQIMSLLQTNQVKIDLSDKETEFSDNESSTDEENKKHCYQKPSGDYINSCFPAVIPPFLTTTLSRNNPPNLFYARRSKREIKVDVSEQNKIVVQHSCNTQTSAEKNVNLRRASVNKFIQTNKKTRCQEVQSPHVFHEDKTTSTIQNALWPYKEKKTQMYEHITENDLMCLEWIDKNLFRVSLNPNTMIIDEKLRDSSEVTCQGSSLFEREISWEQQALCL